MTRDEAINKIRISDLSYSFEAAARVVNALHSLGLLKFNEPKSVYERARDALYSCEMNAAPAVIIAVLGRAGLKIVEKE